MQLSPEIARLVSASLLRLRLRAPFFATLALFARMEAGEWLSTAATDGRDVFINEAFFASLPQAEQDGLLLHEILHAALLHVPRRGTREPRLWNVAADIVINGMIAREQGVALPAGGLRDRRLEHYSVEEVYDLLRHEPARPEPPWVDLLERSHDGAIPDELKAAALEAHWRNAYQQARLVAQGRGGPPAGMEREFSMLEEARIDWRAYLWRYLSRTPVDFGEFDRRFVGRGLYLETVSGESLRVWIAVDTSGSVSDRQLTACLSEIAGIVATYPHLHGELYYADTALHGPYPIAPGAPMPRPVGGGGTDFRPFFRRAAEEVDPRGAMLIYLTDGEGSFPDAPPPYPVLWVVTPGGRDLGTFPFGEAIRLIAGANERCNERCDARALGLDASAPRA